uniref:Putative secreted protein n=1 Tax=Ixodes ricinus TaxID=34613 RepID=A0A147BTB3_IXORI
MRVCVPVLVVLEQFVLAVVSSVVGHVCFVVQDLRCGVLCVEGQLLGQAQDHRLEVQRQALNGLVAAREEVRGLLRQKAQRAPPKVALVHVLVAVLDGVRGICLLHRRLEELLQARHKVPLGRGACLPVIRTQVPQAVHLRISKDDFLVRQRRLDFVSELALGSSLFDDVDWLRLLEVRATFVLPGVPKLLSLENVLDV